jgi:lipid-A-disaccharide synthase
MSAAPSIMVVAGEASGDRHGATLCAALRALAPETRLFGMGGEHMRATGVDLVADVSRRATVGTTEAVSGVPQLYRVYRRLRGLIEREQPRAVVLIEFPEFNLLLARAARRAGIPVVYFVPPQIWAWRRGRIRTIRRLVSLVLAAFPFERDLYHDAGVPVEYVGHPTLDALDAVPSRDEGRRVLGLPAAATVVGLLPGSRHGEALRMLPLMRAVAERLAAERDDVRFVVAQASTLDDGFVHGMLAGADRLLVARDAAPTVMRAADLVLVTSGTATLEAALLGTPMLVCYRVSPATEVMGRMLLRVPWIGLANILLGRQVVPELYLRRDVTVGRVLAETRRLLDDPAARGAQRRAFAELRAELGEPGVGMRAAKALLAHVATDAVARTAR